VPKYVASLQLYRVSFKVYLLITHSRAKAVVVLRRPLYKFNQTFVVRKTYRLHEKKGGGGGISLFVSDTVRSTRPYEL
jgi:hypothetical protein